MGNYKKGQEDLIKKIKEDVSKIVDYDNRDDIMVEVVDLLKNLKPLKKKRNGNN
jgi:hypothetical protein